MALSSSEQIKANSKKALEQVDKRVQRIAFNLFMDIVMNTPELTGALKNNWFPGIGSDFSTETTSMFSKDGGSSSKARIYSTLGNGTFLGKDGVMTLTNNLHYAYRAEYEGWPEPKWSGTIGPYGMVRISLASTIGKIQAGAL